MIDRAWRMPLLLILATVLSTLYAGAGYALGRAPTTLSDLAEGASFGLPLMAILLAHELGHYFAGRLRHVDVSPPYFLPMPFFPFGTLGAVIRIRQRIEDPNALLDVGAAGPIAGLVVALPVLVVGVALSPVEAIDPDAAYLLEGRSAAYLAILYAVHGTIPEGFDVMLHPTALAGWAGLLVTMINLLPFGQLDGGHVAYAWLGTTQDRVSRVVLAILPIVAMATGLAYAWPLRALGVDSPAFQDAATSGTAWLVWAFVLGLMSAMQGLGAARALGARGLAKLRAVIDFGTRHPPTEPIPLGRSRRMLAVAMLALFAALFMPSWMRVIHPATTTPNGPAFRDAARATP